MSPTFLTSAFLAHMWSTEQPSDEPEDSLEPREDPEKGGSSSGSGTIQDQALDGDGDGDDAEQDMEDLDDFEENQGVESSDGPENQDQGSRGVPLTSTG